MAREPGWKQRLDPLDDAYAAMVKAVVAHIDSLNEEEVRQLRADLEKLTTTNCAWTLYQAADIARMFVDSTWVRRKAQASA